MMTNKSDKKTLVLALVALLAIGATAAALPLQQQTATAAGSEASSATSEVSAQVCDPSYVNICLPPAPPDLNCGADVGHARDIVTLPPDPHKLDRDNDGLGCDLTNQRVNEEVEEAVGNDSAVVVEEAEEAEEEQPVIVPEPVTFDNVMVHASLAVASFAEGDLDAAYAEIEIACSLFEQLEAVEALAESE